MNFNACVALRLLWQQHPMVDSSLYVSQHPLYCIEMTLLGFSMNLLSNPTLWQISGLVLKRYLKDPMIYLYNVEFTNLSFDSFFSFAPVSNGVTASLQLLMLNLFRMS